MKILVTGADGQLGYDVRKVLTARNIKNKGVDIADFDITDAKATHNYIARYHPDAVIHCSAWTAVDKAEAYSGVRVCGRFCDDSRSAMVLADSCRNFL